MKERRWRTKRGELFYEKKNREENNPSPQLMVLCIRGHFWNLTFYIIEQLFMTCIVYHF